MPREKLRHEIEARVEFWGFEEEGSLARVRGIQSVEDVTLIRHALMFESGGLQRNCWKACVEWQRVGF